MKRFKNYGLWVAVAALVGMILADAGFNITPEKYDGYVTSILTVLVLAGIISNPSKGKGFTDKNDEK
ncbi:holin [Heyndrickxia oleronia]|uniref:holin n=1 Tax=Heyndrickxia oleronia TaxID=38875 RepID=UPI001C0EF9F0|nr:holin [Heyndrickxia oleronia]MBU5211089.1 holin [Heyndrickxia oleronia]